ncbi:MAG TPA: 2-C-methyl-D-erythritol 4-phosphate cytidylyltransferase [candidate division Zixibacteria bacterium]|nr:2-C-methyl-D-erythritol 4-phosphate cytidylyltransferase [candidate division Zixibacteria bacterium]
MINWAVIVAAGKSVRFGGQIPKQFCEVTGKPLLAWTISAFERAASIDQIILVVDDENYDNSRKNIIEKYKYKKVSQMVIGGTSRRGSVYNALKAILSPAGIVAIHDGARPLVEPKDIDRVVESAKKYKAAMLAVPVTDTVKLVDGDIIVKTLERGKIWLAQTPQAFEFELIKKAHENFRGKSEDITDDASLLENTGIKVKVIEPSSPNPKVTTPEDLVYVEAILRRRTNV